MLAKTAEELFASLMHTMTYEEDQPEYYMDKRLMSQLFILINFNSILPKVFFITKTSVH